MIASLCRTASNFILESLPLCSYCQVHVFWDRVHPAQTWSLAHAVHPVGYMCHQKCHKIQFAGFMALVKQYDYNQILLRIVGCLVLCKSTFELVNASSWQTDCWLNAPSGYFGHWLVCVATMQSFLWVLPQCMWLCWHFDFSDFCQLQLIFTKYWEVMWSKMASCAVAGVAGCHLGCCWAFSVHNFFSGVDMLLV